MSSSLWSDSARVSWEHRSSSNVAQGAVEHDDSFKTDTEASVRISTVFETVNVILDSLNLDSLVFSSLGKEIWLVDSLSS